VREQLVCGQIAGLTPFEDRLRDVRGEIAEADQPREIAEPLVYLCISTMLGAEIVEYPDSGKVNARVADPTSPVGFRRIGMFRADSGTLDYWEGEPEAG